MKRQNLHLIGFAICVLAVLIGVGVGYVNKLIPCSLCYIERFGMMALALLFLLAALTRITFFNLIFSAVILFVSAGGASIAAYHVYLQEQGKSVESCGASLQYLLDTLPATEAFARFIASPQNCGVVDWRFLGVSMAGYALIIFATAFTISFLTLRAKR